MIWKPALMMYAAILSCWFVMIFWLLACIIARCSTLKARPHYDKGPITCITARWSTLKARSHYDRGTRKRSFVFTVRHSVHNNPSKQRRYTKTLFKLEEFENAGFLFSCGKQKYFENGALRTKRWRLDNYVISLTGICPNTNPKWPLIDVDWKHLWVSEWDFCF